MKRRSGFTLWEIATVLLIVAITATLAAPAFVSLGQDKSRTSVDVLMKLLHDTRALAVEHSVEATLLIDPKTGHYRVDTTSTVGSGRVAEDSLLLGATESLETDLPRLRYTFRATGAAFADSVIVRGLDSTRVVLVDAWSGVAYAKAR
jgi:prepilin-type N-terminal cleavage/methylation domain-containing protein